MNYVLITSYLIFKKNSNRLQMSHSFEGGSE